MTDLKKTFLFVIGFLTMWTAPITAKLIFNDLSFEQVYIMASIQLICGGVVVYTACFKERE